MLLAGGLAEIEGKLQPAQNVEIIFEYQGYESVIDIGPVEAFPIPMLTPRWNHGAIVGSDGKVLLYGGLGGLPGQAVPLKATELFNPQ